MLPSLLARDIQQGLKQFLVSGFEPADAFMHRLMSRFVEEESAWLKGPYVPVGLPFVTGSAGRKFFQAFETEHPGYGHQEQAWKRLSSQHLAVRRAAQHRRQQCRQEQRTRRSAGARQARPRHHHG